MERSEEVKSNPTYSNHYCKIFSSQSLTFFSTFVKFLLFIYFLFLKRDENENEKRTALTENSF